MSSQLAPAAARVSSAVRKFAIAASTGLGTDCYMHAALGRALLGDLGFDARLVVGYAAWRVGPGDGDVIGNHPGAQGHLPPGSTGFAYHAWLGCQRFVVDLTTYQLKLKAQMLDVADGEHTTVDWCPDSLILPLYDNRTYEQVRRGRHSGLSYYEARPELDSVLATGFVLDPDDLRRARLILANPDVVVIGPNNRLPERVVDNGVG